MSKKRIKLLTMSDHPLLPSGVATQTKYMIEALLQSDRFEVISLGGAVKHNDYTPLAVDGYDGRWNIFPIDGYGDEAILRRFLHDHKPDMIWFMTDPRFYEWLWMMENEIRQHVPLVYYHVWDNKPIPVFNKNFYDSTDSIVTISKLTSECVRGTAPSAEEVYHPHAVDPDIFSRKTDPESLSKIESMRKDMNLEGKVLFFWNNRNAKRKQSGSLIYWWKDFLDKVGHDKACLIMHTDIQDPHGQPLNYILQTLGLTEGQVRFSTQKLPAPDLALIYNLADCVINIADAEGFGLSSLEALSTETPVINTMTGGLQEQVFDGEQYFGVGIKPASKAIIGSQQVPFIYEDRLSGDDVVAAFEKIYNMSNEERQELGSRGREHVMKNYNFKKYKDFWVHYLEDLHNRVGSWETRKSYSPWEIKEL